MDINNGLALSAASISSMSAGNRTEHIVKSVTFSAISFAFSDKYSLPRDSVGSLRIGFNDLTAFFSGCSLTGANLVVFFVPSVLLLI